MLAATGPRGPDENARETEAISLPQKGRQRSATARRALGSLSTSQENAAKGAEARQLIRGFSGAESAGSALSPPRARRPTSKRASSPVVRGSSVFSITFPEGTLGLELEPTAADESGRRIGCCVFSVVKEFCSLGEADQARIKAGLAVACIDGINVLLWEFEDILDRLHELQGREKRITFRDVRAKDLAYLEVASEAQAAYRSPAPAPAPADPSPPPADPQRFPSPPSRQASPAAPQTPSPAPSPPSPRRRPTAAPRRR